jgi:hypothetical protein
MTEDLHLTTPSHDTRFVSGFAAFLISGSSGICSYGPFSMTLRRRSTVLLGTERMALLEILVGRRVIHCSHSAWQQGPWSGEVLRGGA